MTVEDNSEPIELSAADREELLKLVGAVKVKIMPDNGRMKQTAFATFASESDAKQALFILHQKEIFDRRLVAEFTREHHKNLIPHQSDYTKFESPSTKDSASKSSEKEILRLDAENFSKKLHGVAPALGLDYLPLPFLKYNYPPPTPTIIQNISHALGSVPKFYTQVLHLMNKMNLPAPFGLLTPAPPLAPDANVEDAEEIALGAESMDTSEEESEYESSSDDKTAKIEKILPQKRAATQRKKAAKKLKLSDLKTVPVDISTRQRTEPSEVFESQPICPKKISVKKIENINPASVPTDYETSEGFGAFETSKEQGIADPANEDEDDDELLMRSSFISSRELRRKRISHREMKTLSVFRSQDSVGEPTCRLYIKNLARQVEEKDLRYIYLRFIDNNSEQDRNMFNVTLMKEGRMKGQAFVTLGNEKQAAEAIRETNGFVLHTKPLVVQFARSATKKDKK